MKNALRVITVMLVVGTIIFCANLQEIQNMTENDFSAKADTPISPPPESAEHSIPQASHLPLRFTTRGEFHNAVIEEKRERDGGSEATANSFNLEKIAYYFDFKDVVTDVELYEIRIVQFYISIVYRDKEGKESGDLVIQTARGGVDEDAYLSNIRRISRDISDLVINGVLSIKPGRKRLHLNTTKSEISPKTV